ncbi:MAG: hypothetical protein ACHQ01_07915 [Candidatus Limnocylindrales bacterium]
MTEPEDQDYIALVGYSAAWFLGAGVGRVDAALLVVDPAAIETALATIALGGQVVAPAGLADVIGTVAEGKGMRTISSHHHRHPAAGPCAACDRLSQPSGRS